MSSFVYPATGLLDVTLSDGTWTPPATFGSSANLWGEERVIDMSIGLSVESWAANDSVRFDFGAAVAIDAVAAYIFVPRAEVDVGSTMSWNIFGSANANANSPSTDEASGNVVAPTWNITSFTSDSKRYWFLRNTSGAGPNLDLAEIVVGNKYTFMQDPEDMFFEKIPSVDLGVPYSEEQEYANKTQELMGHWKWTWENINDTMKASLETVRDAVEKDYKPFLYDDGTDITYVRMTPNSLQFKKVGYGIWDTSIELFEQIG